MHLFSERVLGFIWFVMNVDVSIDVRSRYFAGILLLLSARSWPGLQSRFAMSIQALSSDGRFFVFVFVLCCDERHSSQIHSPFRAVASVFFFFSCRAALLYAACVAPSALANSVSIAPSPFELSFSCMGFSFHSSFASCRLL